MEMKELDQQVEQLQQAGLVEDTQSAFIAPAFLVKKPRENMYKYLAYQVQYFVNVVN